MILPLIRNCISAGKYVTYHAQCVDYQVFRSGRCGYVRAGGLLGVPFQSRYKFFMVTRKVPAQVFVNAPDNLSVIPVDLGDYKGVGGLWRLHNELRRKYAIDAFADLHDVLRSKILRVFMRLRGVKVARIHKGRSGKRALTRSSRKVMLLLHRHAHVIAKCSGVSACHVMTCSVIFLKARSHLRKSMPPPHLRKKTVRRG